MSIVQVSVANNMVALSCLT